MAVSITTPSRIVSDVLTGWSVSQGTTPSNPSELPSTSGSINFGYKAVPDSVFLTDDVVTFTHEVLGALIGFVGDITVDDNTVTGNISQQLALLDVERSIPSTSLLPISTIISDYVAVVTDQLSVDYQASSNPLKVVPGWSGSVWDGLNTLCALNNLEIVINGNVVIVRDMGSQTLDMIDETSVSRTISTRGAGLFIDVVYQQSTLISSDTTFKWNYSQNPSVETNATDWSVTVSNGTATTGRVHN